MALNIRLAIIFCPLGDKCPSKAHKPFLFHVNIAFSPPIASSKLQKEHPARVAAFFCTLLSQRTKGYDFSSPSFTKPISPLPITNIAAFGAAFLNFLNKR